MIWAELLADLEHRYGLLDVNIYEHGDVAVAVLTMRALTAEQFAFPVGTPEFPPGAWYAASFHDLTGALNGGYKHTGIDLNLDKSPWGDVERGFPVFAIAAGVVTYTTPDWSGVPMCVIRHQIHGTQYWTRYAHIDLQVAEGDTVRAGDIVGTIADWRTGDHLHFDMARTEFTREWLSGAEWVDPVPVLKSMLDPFMVERMLNRGD